MKRNLKNIILVAAAIAIFGACKKNEPDQWLQDNITIVGQMPVIASFTVVAPQTTTVAAGSTVNLDLRYYSVEDIDKINLNATVGSGAKQAVSSMPYQKAYSSVTRTDSLLLTYQVPAGLSSGTTITMEAQVVNKNTLSKSTTLALKVQ